MATQVKLLKNLSLILAALVITLTAVLTFAAEEIVLTTIMPTQDTLRVRRGVVGVDWRKTDTLSNEDIGDNNLLIRGNVGIGTTSPGAKLHVSGDGSTILVPVKSTSSDPTGSNGMVYYNEALGKFRVYENGEWKDFVTSGRAFGSWTNLDSNSNALVKNAIYQVGSDGFVCAYVTTINRIMYGYTDSSDSPTTVRFVVASAHAATGNPKGSFTMPVRKNDYWRITGNPDSIYWLPIGIGACVKPYFPFRAYVSLEAWRKRAFRTSDTVFARVTVRVSDSSGPFLAGATVRGTFTRGGARSGTTNSSGQVTFQSAWVGRTQTATFTVNSITKGSVTYELTGTLSITR